MKKYRKISDEKKCIVCFILTVLFGIILFCTYTAEDSNDHEGILRLHVIANSNTVADQSIKLQVRDAVIKHMQSQEDIVTKDDMKNYIISNRTRLEKIAEGVVASQGSDDKVTASLGIRYIPEKTYGGITFPAGNYEALDLTIGEGNGENWWCVLFPPLCLLEEGTDEPEETSDTTDSLTEDQKLQLRWKLQELL